MARIRHIAIRTPDPEKTAAFYKDVLGLREVGQARTGCSTSTVRCSVGSGVAVTRGS